MITHFLSMSDGRAEKVFICSSRVSGGRGERRSARPDSDRRVLDEIAVASIAIGADFAFATRRLRFGYYLTPLRDGVINSITPVIFSTA